MDELELLKKDWKRQEENLPRVNIKDIYKMIHHKSSSLTKWILVIAIIEFVFWTILSIATSSKDSWDEIRALHIYELNIVLTVLHYSVLAFFIYWFYKNYMLISTTDSTKQLMNNILRVRKTVNYYVIYNLAMIFVVLVMVITASAFYDPKFQHVFENKTDKGDLIAWGPILGLFAFMLVILLLFWLFYKLLYGILLRRLRRNYKELNKLELRN
tara:strand:+ start:323 stop:964 length:642 start_codon:yes stop_codon:yes gene_type:complete